MNRKIVETGIFVTNMKHTQKRAQLEKLYLSVQTKIPFRRRYKMKVLFVATVQSHIAQFHLKIIEVLKQEGWEIHVAARDNLAQKNGLQLKNVDKVYNILFQRSPFSPKNLKAYREVKKVITGGKYDIIHCNTPVGGILTRIAGRKEKGNVFYTAHGFHFYKGAPLLNWFIYYPIEKVMAHYTDKLITITDEGLSPGKA